MLTLRRGLALACIPWAATLVDHAQARVTKLTVTNKVSPAYNGQSFGQAGQYETYTGTITGEVDPADRRSAIIQDDPRLSLEERYPSFTAFYYQASAVLNRLVAQRYMRAEDAAAEFNAALTSVLDNDLIPKDGLAEALVARRVKAASAMEGKQ